MNLRIVEKNLSIYLDYINSLAESDTSFYEKSRQRLKRISLLSSQVVEKASECLNEPPGCKTADGQCNTIDRVSQRVRHPSSFPNDEDMQREFGLSFVDSIDAIIRELNTIKSIVRNAEKGV